MSTQALFELAVEYRQTADILQDTDADIEIVEAALDAQEWTIEQKVISTAMVIKNIEVLAAAIKAQEETMYRRRKAAENRIQYLKSRIVEAFEITGLKKIPAAALTVGIQLNPAKVVIDDLSLLPSDYMRTPPAPPPEPDKEKIREDIEAGVIVPGASMVRTNRVVIK